MYKIEATNVVLGIDELEASTSTIVKSIGNRVFVSNVQSNSEVNIYNLTGALVKSIKTNEDMNFSLKTGLYIGVVTTSQGQKSVKLLVQ